MLSRVTARSILCPPVHGRGQDGHLAVEVRNKFLFEVFGEGEGSNLRKAFPRGIHAGVAPFGPLRFLVRRSLTRGKWQSLRGASRREVRPGRNCLVRPYVETTIAISRTPTGVFGGGTRFSCLFGGRGGPMNRLGVYLYDGSLAPVRPWGWYQPLSV